MIKKGLSAPDFTLKSDSGSQVTLSTFQGKKVILYFYPKDSTSGCTAEALSFKEAKVDLEKQNAVILGISKDGVSSHRKFKEKNELPFTLLSDPTIEVQKMYGVWVEKTLYGKKFMGTQRTTFLIDEKGVIKKIYLKVKPKDHAQNIVSDLKIKS